MTENTLQMSDLILALGRSSTFGPPGRVKRVATNEISRISPTEGRVLRTIDQGREVYYANGSEWLLVDDNVGFRTPSLSTEVATFAGRRRQELADVYTQDETDDNITVDFPLQDGETYELVFRNFTARSNSDLLLTFNNDDADNNEHYHWYDHSGTFQENNDELLLFSNSGLTFPSYSGVVTLDLITGRHRVMGVNLMSAEIETGEVQPEAYKYNWDAGQSDPTKSVQVHLDGLSEGQSIELWRVRE